MGTIRRVEVCLRRSEATPITCIFIKSQEGRVTEELNGEVRAEVGGLRGGVSTEVVEAVQ